MINSRDFHLHRLLLHLCVIVITRSSLLIVTSMSFIFTIWIAVAMRSRESHATEPNYPLADTLRAEVTLYSCHNLQAAAHITPRRGHAMLPNHLRKQPSFDCGASRTL